MEDMLQVITRKLPLLMEQRRIRLVVVDSLASLCRAEYVSPKHNHTHIPSTT